MTAAIFWLKTRARWKETSVARDWLPSSPTPKRLTWRAFKQSTSDDLVGSAIMPVERIEMLGSPPPI